MPLKWCMLLIALAAGECLEHKEGDLFLGAETQTQRLQNAEQEAFFFFFKRTIYAQSVSGVRCLTAK